MNFDPTSVILDQPVHPKDLDLLRRLVQDKYFATDESNERAVNLMFLYCTNGECDDHDISVAALDEHSVLNRAVLHEQISKFRMRNGRRYNVGGIYCHQVGYSDTDLETLLQDSNSTFPFDWTDYKKLQDIMFMPSLELFQHHNYIVVVFTTETTKKTRKVEPTVPQRKTLKNI
jgi:hypothetical protein